MSRTTDEGLNTEDTGGGTSAGANMSQQVGVKALFGLNNGEIVFVLVAGLLSRSLFLF